MSAELNRTDEQTRAQGANRVVEDCKEIYMHGTLVALLYSWYAMGILPSTFTPTPKAAKPTCRCMRSETPQGYICIVSIVFVVFIIRSFVYFRDSFVATSNHFGILIMPGLLPPRRGVTASIVVEQRVDLQVSCTCILLLSPRHVNLFLPLLRPLFRNVWTNIANNLVGRLSVLEPRTGIE